MEELKIIGEEDHSAHASGLQSTFSYYMDEDHLTL